MILRAKTLPARLMVSTTVLLAAAVATAQPATTTPTTAPPAYATSTADPVEALGRYLRVLSTMPRNLDALTGAGKAALAIGDANAAISFFARAEEISPRDGRIKFGLASALVQVEQPRTALKLFSEAVSLGVSEGEVAGDRGLAHDLRGESRRAQADYVQALRWRPDDEITRRLAVSQAISGDRQAAMATLDALLRRQDRAAWRIRAFVLALTGDRGGAEEAALAVMPRGQAEALLPYFGRLAALGPGQKAAAVHLGQFPADGRSSAAQPVFAGPVSTGAPPPVGGPRSDVPLIPSGAALGATTTSADSGSSRAPRRRPGSSELAGLTRPTTSYPVSPPQARAPGYPVATPATSYPAPARPTLPAPAPAPPAAASGIVQQPLPIGGTVPWSTAPAPAATAIARAPTPQPSSPNSAPAAGAPLTSIAPTVPATSATVPPVVATASQPGPAPTAYATPPATPVAPPPLTAGSLPVPSATAGAAPLQSATAERPAPGFSTDPLAPRSSEPTGVGAPASPPPSPPVGPPAPVALAMATPSPAVTGFVASAPMIRAVDLPGSAVAGPAATPSAQTPAGASPFPAQVSRPPVERSVPPTPPPSRQARVIAPAPKSAPAKNPTEDKSSPAKTAGKGKDAARGKPADDEDRPTKLASADPREARSKTPATKSDKTSTKDKAESATTSSKDGKGKQASAKDAKTKEASAKEAAAKDAKAKDAGTKTAGKDSKAKDGKGKDVAAREAEGDGKGDKATKTPAGERYWVQVASGANRSDLGKAWERTKAKAPKLLGGRATYTAPWKQSNRLLVGPFKSEGEAQGFVNSLAKAGTGGIQFTSRGGMKVEPLGNE